MKELIRRVPVLGDLVRKIYWRITTARGGQKPFQNSASYWEQRYAEGGDSGVGSYDKFASFKAEIINAYVTEHGIQNVIEFGCGDGNQLELANYPSYVGIDVSRTVIEKCQAMFGSDSTKSFLVVSEYDGIKADLALSLDVIYHLVEDQVFQDYMQRLFEAADRHVIIYSSDTDENAGYEGTHVRHRNFTVWVRENAIDWELVQKIVNRYPYTGDFREGSFADFYIYRKRV